MADTKRNTVPDHRRVSIRVTVAAAKAFRATGLLKEYQKFPKPGELSRGYSVSPEEAKRILCVAKHARHSVDRRDHGKKKAIGCFLRHAEHELANCQFRQLMAQITKQPQEWANHDSRQD